MPRTSPTRFNTLVTYPITMFNPSRCLSSSSSICKSIYLIFLIIFLSSHVTSNSIIIPVKELSKPGPIRDHHLNCKFSLFHEEGSTSNFQIIPSIHPDGEHNTLSGYLCAKREYSATCFRGFFGGDTKSRSSKLVSITKAECESAVALWKEDELPRDTNLDHDCTWMSTEVKSKFRFEIVPTELQFDNYNGKVVDSVLAGGSCMDKFCPTKHSGVYWITEHELSYSCPRIISGDTKLIMGDQDKPETIYFSSNYIPNINLKGACKDFFFCKYRGVVLKTGHFVLESENIPLTIQNIIKRLPSCPEKMDIVSNNFDSAITSAKMSIEKLYLMDKCEEVIDNIKSGKNITRYELSYLNPLITGIGDGFVTRKGEVLVGSYKYDLANSIEVNCDSCKNCSLTATTDHGVVKIPSNLIDCICGDIPKCYLPNGLKVDKSGVVNPLIDLDVDLFYEMKSQIVDPHYIPHISPDHNDPIPVPDTDTEVTDLTSGGFWDGLSKWLGNVFNDFKYLIYIVILIIVIIFLPKIMKFLSMVCWCCKTKREKVHNTPTIRYIPANLDNNKDNNVLVWA